jgi:hypothetical protein
MEMKHIFFLSLASVVFLCSVYDLWAQDNEERRVWINPERYKIVLLKPVGGEWASGFNEVILLDSDTGQTWTLKGKSLKDGWVLMPRKDGYEKKP